MERLKEWLEPHTALELREGEGVGRYLVASRNVAEGEILLLQYPYAWCIFEDFKRSTCRFCMGPIASAMEDGSQLPPVLQARRQERERSCGKCRQVFYCSAVCQHQDAAEHYQEECRMLAQLHRTEQAYQPGTLSEITLLLRLLSRRKCEQAFGLPTPEPSDSEEEEEEEKGEKEEGGRPKRRVCSWTTNKDFSDYKLLVSGVDDFPEEELASYRYWVTAYLANLQRYFAGNARGDLTREQKISLEETSEELMLEALCRNRRNSFCFGNGAHEDPQGHGVYLAAALFNHSCKPNVRLATLPAMELAGTTVDLRKISTERSNATGPLLAFVAARFIAKGEQVSISYLDNGMLHEDDASVVNDPTNPYNAVHFRRNELQSSFLFHCQCEHCMRQERDEQAKEQEQQQQAVVVQEAEDELLLDEDLPKEEADGSGQEADEEACQRAVKVNEKQQSDGVANEDHKAWLWLAAQEQLLGSEHEMAVGKGGQRARFRIEGFTVKLDASLQAQRHAVIRVLGTAKPQAQHEVPWNHVAEVLAKAVSGGVGKENK